MIICSAQGYSFSSKDNIPSETREYGNWFTNCVTNTTTYMCVSSLGISFSCGRKQFTKNNNILSVFSLGHNLV